MTELAAVMAVTNWSTLVRLRLSRPVELPVHIRIPQDGLPGAPLIAHFAMSGISRGKASSMNWGLVRPWIQEALDALGFARNDL